MIIYKSNENWLGDMRHLAKSWTMVKVMRAVTAAGVYSIVICLFYVNCIPETEESLINSAFSFLGIVLSILLVFRTNSAYDRWWEGRKQWGALVNNTRNMAVYAHTMLPAEFKKERSLLAKHISNFCHAMVEHLRNGTKLETLIHLTEEEKAHYATKKHVPNIITQQIYSVVHVEYKKHVLTEADLINFGTLHKSLLDIIGACERIKKTPIPFSYAVFMKIFITVYSVLLPFALAPQMGLAAIPVVMLVVFAFVGIELMGEEIEDPFGLDCNDLPTSTIANTIQDNVYEVFEIDQKEHITAKELYDKIF